jgi:hypothetical protein
LGGPPHGCLWGRRACGTARGCDTGDVHWGRWPCSSAATRSRELPRMFCPPPGEGIAKDRLGQVLCGPGECVRDGLGKILCSSQPRGYAGRDLLGAVQCIGGCVEDRIVKGYDSAFAPPPAGSLRARLEWFDDQVSLVQKQIERISACGRRRWPKSPWWPDTETGQ